MLPVHNKKLRSHERRFQNFWKQINRSSERDFRGDTLTAKSGLDESRNYPEIKYIKIPDWRSLSVQLLYDFLR